MIDKKKLIERLWKRHREVQNNDDDYSNEEAEIICSEICNIVSIIDEQPQADKWIPCEERLPEENTEVLVTVEEIDGDCYTQGSWLQDGQWVIKKTPLNPTVVAWMQKPQPYKKEGAE